MKIKEIKASSIITKSGLPGADFVVNPYVGCSHSCIYCYARFMKRFTGHTETWGDFIDVKTNAIELVPNKSEKYRGKSFFISSVTDAYLPLERKYKLTRGVLEKLIPLELKIGIQSKSDLIVRDIDLFKQFKCCEVGMTMTTLDDKIRMEIEPGTSSVERRISALKELKKAGITTYVFIGPILPFITDWKRIILETKDFVDSYMFENLNVKGTIWNSIKNWLINKHPELLKKYEEIYFSKNDFWKTEEEKIRNFCRENKIEGKVYFHHKRK